MPLSQKESAQLKRFGANARRERTRLNLTQEKLAELVDLHPRTLQKVEAGEVNLLLTTIHRFHKALECPWEKLMD